MKIKSACLFLLLSVTVLSASAQTKKMFSQTPDLIQHYREGAKAAWAANNQKLAQTYYDSIRNCVLNSYVDEYRFVTYKGEIFDTKEIKKPMLITVSASWCSPCREEISALNKLADEYKDKICFVVLFWDTKDGLADLISKYSQNIVLVPATNKQPGENGTYSLDIAGFRHVNGFPTSYGILNKQIISLSEGGAVSGSYDKPNGEKEVVTPEMANEFNYKRLKTEIDKLL